MTSLAGGKADAARAVAASPADTARALRDLKFDQGMTQRALNVLQAGGPNAYERALGTLRADTRVYWQVSLTKDPEDGVDLHTHRWALQAWIEHHWTELYEQPITELQHRRSGRP